MAENKKFKSKSSSKKITTKPTTPKIEETPKPEAQSYLVPLSFLREPIEKNIPVADIFYHKFSNSFQLQCSAPQHEAAIEDIVEGDISIDESSGSIKMISKSENPVSWIINLNKSKEFSGNPFIAGEAQEIYEA
tara:strand:+ start:1059 stop:1460 length:402 start_codon:yes stop_codon:yes gene_type:complete